MQTLDLAIAIRKLYHLSMHAMEKELLKIGLTVQQVTVLKLLAHDGAMQHHELMQRMELSKGTMSGILKRLEEKALIKRSVMAHDRRNITFDFTERGKAFAQEFHVLMDEAMSGLFRDLSESDLTRYRLTLSEMIDYLEEK